MSYKTILVHVDLSSHTAERVRIAAKIAVAEQAHLIGAAMTGISRYIYESGAVDPRDPMLASHFTFLRERAHQALAEFDAIVRQMGLPSWEKRLVDDEAAGGVSLQGRYSDLVVIDQVDPNEPLPGVMPDFPESVVLHCGRPALIVPYRGGFTQAGERVLIGWNASIEATRAVAGSLPLLKRAQNVVIVVFNALAPPVEPNSQPGDELAQYLSRHGIAATVAPQRTDQDIGQALLSLAADIGSDLIVMGGYGHSRFREILLGGATRTVLQSMTVPVLMAH